MEFGLTNQWLFFLVVILCFTPIKMPFNDYHLKGIFCFYVRLLY
ncbi:hypothetical protein D104_12945 [Marinomonas profundimaris]|uniref:Uncharacterized protein n=1 Tax=Marinomonas profundimaris TaxID=1208321 RepID=W1RWZ2_9GAMM|nr:hypothetical protein D104_12945 [Marinomonas profundimaris]